MPAVEKVITSANNRHAIDLARVLSDAEAAIVIERKHRRGLMDINEKRREMADLRDKMIKYGISASPEPISGKPLYVVVSSDEFFDITTIVHSISHNLV